MKTLYNIWHVTVSIFIYALWGFGLSAFFSTVQYILSLLHFCGQPSLYKFLWGGVGLTAFFVLKGVYNVCLYLYRCRKEPVFKHMSQTGGISWKTYKEQKEGRKKERREEVERGKGLKEEIEERKPSEECKEGTDLVQKVLESGGKVCFRDDSD